MGKLTGRRMLNRVTILAIAATGAIWAGCGNDAEDEANEIIDSAQEQLDEAIDDADAESQELQDEINQLDETQNP